MVKAYVAGPMRGHDLFNFPAFDEATAWLRGKGWTVVSPAEMDRAMGFDESLYPETPDWFTMESALRMDLQEITAEDMDAIVFLPEWVLSRGSRIEAVTGLACGLDFYLYQPEGTYEQGGGFNPDRRLIAVTPEIIEFMMKEENHGVDDRITSSTGGQKAQNDIRYDLIPPESLEEVARVYGHGATKYAPNNWKLGYDYSLSLAALYRHLAAWHAGEEDDKEGFKHLAAVVFHALTLIYRDKFQTEWDDVR